MGWMVTPKELQSVAATSARWRLWGYSWDQICPISSLMTGPVGANFSQFVVAPGWAAQLVLQRELLPSKGTWMGWGSGEGEHSEIQPSQGQGPEPRQLQVPRWIGWWMDWEQPCGEVAGDVGRWRTGHELAPAAQKSTCTVERSLACKLRKGFTWRKP